MIKNSEEEHGLNTLIEETIHIMNPKIKKSLKNTSFQEREDLRQDIFLKIIKAVKLKRIKPITFWEFKDLFDQNKEYE